jgi:acyl dehydratase
MSDLTPGFAPGKELPALQLPPVDLVTLHRYADASGDHALIHLDTDAARSAGFPNVIAHGLLVMAYLGRAVGEWFPDGQLLEFGCRFMAATLVGDQLTCLGRVMTTMAGASEQVVELDLRVVDQRSEIKLKGSARIAIVMLESVTG